MAQTSGKGLPDECGPSVRRDEAGDQERAGGELSGTSSQGLYQGEQEEGAAQVGLSFWPKLARDTFETLLLAVVLFVAVRSTLQNTRVDGHSMEPTLHNGQYVMVNKLALRLGSPQRGDIVVFRSPQDERRALIKRVVGLPGEEVMIRSGVVYINGVALAEPYVAPNPPSGDWGPQVLGPGEYMLLGDNRDNSNDSRNFGPVSASEFIGKAWFSLWPPTYGLALPHESSQATGAEPTAR